MSFDPFWGGGTQAPCGFDAAIARYEHLPIYKAALNMPLGFEKLVTEAESDLGRLRERSVRWPSFAYAQQ